MHDLRKKALLESGKTISRKAKARPDSNVATPSDSPATSPRGSKVNSRAGSRYASEDEGHSGSEFDDNMTMSTTSASDHGGDDDSEGAWVDRLRSRISQIQAGGRTSERKRMAVQEREDMLKSYLHLVRHYYSRSELTGAMKDIVAGLMRAAKSGGSAMERSIALKAVAVTILTNPEESVFETILPGLKSACESDESEEVKAAAIYALTVGAMYGDGSTAAAEDMLEYLIEIIESDGQTVEAPDSAPVVVAAMKSWGFIAAHLEDLSDQSEQALEAFIEQLDSTDVYVQTSAGNNIALLFEAAREAEEEGEGMNLKYDPKRLAQRMRDISRGSKSISKRDRRVLKSDFSSIATGLERGKGPGYSTSGFTLSNPHTGGSKVENDKGEDMIEFGYRDTIMIGTERLTIDSWSLSAKIELFRTVLSGGFSTHFSKNPTVSETL